MARQPYQHHLLDERGALDDNGGLERIGDLLVQLFTRARSGISVQHASLCGWPFRHRQRARAPRGDKYEALAQFALERLPTERGALA